MMPWLVQTLVAATLLMALVLLVRAPVRRLFGARAAYALWLLPALRMVLPPLPGFRQLFVPVAVFHGRDATVGLVDVATAARISGAPGAAGVSLPGAAPMPLLDPALPIGSAWPVVITLLWLGIAAVVLALGLLRYRAFLRRALAQAVPLSVECGVAVLASPAVPGPLATGVFRRRILLPADFLTRYTPEERRLALLHEGAHHDRLDIAANFLALVVRALHWWNPLAHVAHRAFRADQELACDETVLTDPRNSRAAYGRALLKSAVAHTPAMACALNPKAQLKQRIRTMAHAPLGRARLAAGALVATLAIAAGTVATASGRLPVSPVPPLAPLPPMPIAAPAPPEPVAAVPPAPPVSYVRMGAPVPAARRHIGEEARRAAEHARQAARDAEAQARIAERAAERARAMIDPADAHRMVEALQAATRARMAAACVARGAPVPASADFRALALCGQDMHRTMRLALASARKAIAVTNGLTEVERARALAGIDAAMAREMR